MRPWAPKFQLFRHGFEQEPVLVVDDFARDPEKLIEEAAGLSYRPIGPNYPGVRAPVSAAFLAALRQSMGELIHNVFGATDALDAMEAYFSIVTTSPSQLRLLQRLPHFDGVGPERIAMLHHLGRAERGGTAFFRHRASGFETVSAERLPVYNRAVNAELVRLGLPRPRYMGEDDPIWERIALYPARFNRLLVYRGCALHSADIPDDLPLPADVRTGRFSINTFLWRKSSEAQSQDSAETSSRTNPVTLP